MRKWLLIVPTVLLPGCGEPATEADRTALTAIWLPDDGSGRNVEFKADGVFDYQYDRGYTLRLDWKLASKGRVALTSGNGVTVSCNYTITDASLAIDNGSGAACVSPGVTPPSPIPTKFKRAG